MKVNPRAMSRLIKAFIGKEKIAIPIKERSKIQYGTQHDQVYLVPVKSIVRNEQPYKNYRIQTPDTPRPYSVSHVNNIRKSIRKGDKIEPILLRHLNAGVIHDYSLNNVKPHHHFLVINGHHRLTAHQAEGKKFIRATIVGANSREPSKPISLPPDSSLDRAWDDPNG